MEQAKQIRLNKELAKLHEDRQRQFADNDARLKEAKRLDREMFLKVVQTQRENEEKERKQMAARRTAYLHYKKELNSQM